MPLLACHQASTADRHFVSCGNTENIHLKQFFLISLLSLLGFVQALQWNINCIMKYSTAKMQLICKSGNQQAQNIWKCKVLPLGGIISAEISGV